MIRALIGYLLVVAIFAGIAIPIMMRMETLKQRHTAARKGEQNGC